MGDTEAAMRLRPFAVLAAAVVSVAIATTSADGLSAARLPPDLRHLLAAGRHLRVTSFLVDQSVVETREAGAVPLSRLTERGSLSPPRYALSSSVEGRPEFFRYVGSYAYGTAPGLARIDGGHKWVRVRLGNLAGGRSNVTGLIRSLLTNVANVVLPPATSVQELGPTTLGGQVVSEFLVDTTASPVSTTRVFLAPDGLPVRTVETVGHRVTTTDTSITAPVVVRVPPRRETVDESRLSPAQQQRVNGVLAAPPGLQ